MTTTTQTDRMPIVTIAGCTVQIDPSGQGHAWRDATPDDVPADIQRDIECEIIDGGHVSSGCYRGSNGLHYRWA